MKMLVTRVQEIEVDVGAFRAKYSNHCKDRSDDEIARYIAGAGLYYADLRTITSDDCVSVTELKEEVSNG